MNYSSEDVPLNPQPIKQVSSFSVPQPDHAAYAPPPAPPSPYLTSSVRKFLRETASIVLVITIVSGVVHVSDTPRNRVLARSSWDQTARVAGKVGASLDRSRSIASGIGNSISGFGSAIQGSVKGGVTHTVSGVSSASVQTSLAANAVSAKVSAFFERFVDGIASLLGREPKSQLGSDRASTSEELVAAKERLHALKTSTSSPSGSTFSTSSVSATKDFPPRNVPPASTTYQETVRSVIIVDGPRANVESVRGQPIDAVAEGRLSEKLQELENKLSSKLSSSSVSQSGGGTVIINQIDPSITFQLAALQQQISLTNRIDKLGFVSVTNTVTGTPGALTDADVPDTITVSNYLPLAGGTLTGVLTATDLIVSGNLTVSGAQSFSGAIVVPYLTATSTTATSTFLGGVAAAALTANSATIASGLTVTGGGAAVTGNVLLNGSASILSGGSLHVGNTVVGSQEMGVGSSTPGGALAIQNSIPSKPALIIYGTSSQSGPLFDIYDNSVSNTNLFRITPAGNVGIGTSSPYAKLSVAGDVVGERFTATGTAPSLLPYASSTAISVSGQAYFGSTTTFNGVGYRFPALDGLGGQVLVTNGAGGLSWGTGSLWTSSGSDISFVSGNVGIGTTSPYAKLSVTGQVVGQYFTATGTTASFFPYASTTGLTVSGPAFLLGTTTLNGVPYRFPSSDGIDGQTLTTNGSGVLSWDQGSSSSWIDSGSDTYRLLGNVGIGTSSPYAKLSVAGPVVAEYFTATSTTGTSTFSGGFSAGGSSGLSVLPNGYLGLGTAAPRSFADIAGNLRVTNITGMPGNGAGGGLEMNYNPGNGRGTLYAYDRTANTYQTLILHNFVTFTSGEKLSIGTIGASSQKLSVYEGVSTSTRTYNADFLDTTPYGYGVGGALSLSGKYTSGGSYTELALIKAMKSNAVDGEYGSNLLLYTRQNGLPSMERLRIDDMGRIGMSTTSPWRTLSVAGTVGFDGLTSLSSSGDALCLTSDKEVRVNTGTQTCTVSSLRFKHDVADLMGGMDLVARLRPVEFKLNETNDSRLGFIAEEVDALEPRLVSREADGRARSVRYEDMTAVLAKALQEQHFSLQGIETRLASLEDGSGSQFVSQVGNKIGEFFGLKTEQLTVGTPQNPTGITLHDEVTGQPYCIKVSDGSMKAVPGGCEESVLSLTDTASPVITILGNNPAIILQGSSYNDLGARAVDAADGEVLVDTIGGEITTETLGTSTVTYVARDSAQNTATATRTVIVTD